jgi:hypothetical protein
MHSHVFCWICEDGMRTVAGPFYPPPLHPSPSGAPHINHLYVFVHTHTRTHTFFLFGVVDDDRFLVFFLFYPACNLQTTLMAGSHRGCLLTPPPFPPSRFAMHNGRRCYLFLREWNVTPPSLSLLHSAGGNPVKLICLPFIFLATCSSSQKRNAVVRQHTRDHTSSPPLPSPFLPSCVACFSNFTMLVSVAVTLIPLTAPTTTTNFYSRCVPLLHPHYIAASTY